MKKTVLLVCAACLLAFPQGHAAPLGLSEACEKAMEHDAQLRAAQADHAAQKEEVRKARANFLPNARFSASRGRNSTEHTALQTDATQDYYYNSVNYGFSVRQPILNFTNFASYGQAKAVVAKSEAKLQNERYDTLERTVEVYFNALYSEDNLDFSMAQMKASEEQLEQARRAYGAGFGTITEINEAKADYEMAQAEALASTNGIEFNRRELERLTGVYPEELRRLAPGKLVLAMPEPQNVQQWIDQALERNALVSAARHEVRIARKQVDKNRAGRYPTLDLVATQNVSQSDNNYSIGSEYNTYSLNLQLNVPIYSGGYVSAAVRQSSAGLTAARERQSQQERAVTSDVRKYYNSLMGSIAQIRAYEQAVTSSEIALTGTRKGYKAGLRSNVDVLNAQEKLFLNKRNLAKSRYQYIINLVLLKRTAGDLTAADIAKVDGWME
jgi:protease secretion system outer membrane protein